MEFYILASGSKGNSSVFVNKNQEILLVDCGISINDIKKKFLELNLDFNQIKAVLITHLHTDHCKYMRAFNKNLIYAHKDTFLDLDKSHLLDDYQEINILGFNLTILPMSHDIEGTLGFIMNYNQERLAFITDTGYLHVNIQRLINNCDTYLIESNYDPRMLMLSNRPNFLKQRILSMRGHLSNQDCALILANVMGPKTKEIVFIHRSLETNSENLLLNTFFTIMKQKNIDCSHLIINIADQFISLVGGSLHPSLSR